MPKRTTIEPIFRALGNETRLAIVERLSSGPSRVSELAAPFDMALPSLMQHLDVLERAGLVRSAKQGRVRTVRLHRDALQSVEDWLAGQRVIWETRLDQLDNHLRETDDAGEME